MRRMIVVVGLLILMTSTVFGQLPDYVSSHHFELDGRAFLVEYPTRGFTQPEVPLIVMLHGGGGDSDGYNMNSHMFLLLQHDEAIILFPQGAPEDEEHPWIPTDRFWVSDIVDELIRLMGVHFPGHSIDEERMYCVGSSNGGWMAHLIGYMESDRYAAIASISGGWPGNSYTSMGPPAHKVGVIMFHNRWDTRVRIGQTSRNAWFAWSDWNDADNVSVDHGTFRFFTYSAADDSGTEWQRFYVLNHNEIGTSNHGWPHMDPYGVEPVAEIWPFFQQFTRSSGATASESEEVVELPSTYEYQVSSYPNPFNPTATVEVTLAETAELTVHVFNVNGQLVQTLATGSFAPGDHKFTLNGSSLPSGVYFVHANTAGWNDVQKVVLMK